MVSIYKYKGLVGLPAIAEAHGMNKATLYRRVVNMGLSIEEAVSIPLTKSRRPLENKKQTDEGSENRVASSWTPLWRLALGIGAKQC